MNVDTSKSRYKTPEPSSDFTRHERRHLLRILRRLQFLEHVERTTEGLVNPHTEKEIEALEWILVEMGFLPSRSD